MKRKLRCSVCDLWWEHTIHCRRKWTLRHTGRLRLQRGHPPSVQRPYPSRWGLCWKGQVEITLESLHCRREHIFLLLLCCRECFLPCFGLFYQLWWCVRLFCCYSSAIEHDHTHWRFYIPTIYTLLLIQFAWTDNSADNSNYRLGYSLSSNTKPKQCHAVIRNSN